MKDNSCAFSPSHIAAGVALILVGAVIGAFADPYLPAVVSNSQKGYQTGFDAAKKVVENSPLGSLVRTSDDVRVVSGTITAINGQQFTLHTQVAINPFETAQLIDRTVLLTANTKVTLSSPKDSKIVQQIMSQPRTSTSTSLYNQTAVSASSLKVGDSVLVTATENAQNLAQFSAAEIQILPQLFAK